MMSANEAKCSTQHHEDTIKIEQAEDKELDYSLLSPNVKSESGQNDQTCYKLSDSGSESDLSLLIKKEPEDSRLNYDLKIPAENLPLEEKIDFEEHKPGLKLSGGINSFEQPNFPSNNKRGKYNCARCPFITNKKFNFTQHYVRCHIHKDCTDMYKCNKCWYETKIKSDLILHFKRKHSELTKVKCEECAYETRRKDHLTLHYKNKHLKDADRYKCEECSFETKYEVNFSKHYQRKHSKDAEVYKCEECSFETRNKRYFTQHYKNKHSVDAEAYKCGECSYETMFKSNFTKHCKLKHTKEAEVYKCEECSYKTTIRFYFKRHCRRHK